jgi:anaerobic magnesium-protoporphyrin IX monomethyl ester cyclase
LRVLLINPPRFHGIPVIREERCEITERSSVIPPYSLLQIASILMANGHEVKLTDANGQNLNFEQVDDVIKKSQYDILIFRFTPTTFDNDNKIASISKANHPNAITAGICWTLRTLPQSVLQLSTNLDVYIMHEYETVALSLVRAISEGNSLSSVRGIAYRSNEKITVNDPAEPMSNWESLPMPAYSLLPSLDKYFINTRHGSPFSIIYGSKGCPFSCIYCTERKTKLKNRSAEKILDELTYLKKNFNIKTISFFDETFTLDRQRTIAIADGIKKNNLKITWYCNTRVNLVDPELLSAMYAGGCRGISFGIESGNQQILDNAQKGVTVTQAENAIKQVKKAGIKSYCSFVFGLPGENWDTIKETIRFVKRTLPTGAQFNVAVPYPGTELYNIATQKGWIKPAFDWRELYQHAAIMRTDELSPAELEKARKMAYRALYFNSRWVLQNLKHTLYHPEDLHLATGYVVKITRNYVLHKMEHAH